MTARAKRRDDARTAAKVMEKSGAADLDTISELAAARRDLDLSREWLKTYKTRLERIAMALQFISNRIIEGNIPAAQVAMRSTLANDLAEARETVGNRAQALDIAVEALTVARDRKWTEVTDGSGPVDATEKEKGLYGYVGATTCEAEAALSKIKTLAPEAFGGEVAMTQAPTARA